MLGAGVREPEEDDPSPLIAGERGEVAEIEVERQDDPLFSDAPRKMSASGVRCMPSSRSCTAS
jgi:hypothetical protein